MPKVDKKTVEKNANTGFNVKRSCLQEIKLLSRPKTPTVLGFRQPTDEQYDESRGIVPKVVESQKQFYMFFNKQRNFDLMGSLLANFGLALSLINYEYVVGYFDDKGIKLEDWPNAN